MSNIEKLSIDAIWDKLAKHFNNWQGLKPKKIWFTKGISERSAYNRVELLESNTQAKFVSDLTSNLNDDEMLLIHTRAKVNVEQAQSASRSATVLNVTIIIGFIVLFNQIFPGAIVQFLNEAFFDGNLIKKLIGIFTILLCLFTSISVTAYCHAGALQAQDLKHLLEINVAKRKLMKNHIDNTETKHDEKGLDTDLAENFISDF